MGRGGGGGGLREEGLIKGEWEDRLTPGGFADVLHAFL